MNKYNQHMNTNTNTNNNRKPKLVPGISGLMNLGNTCYLNAILQPLSHTIPFVSYIIKQSYTESLNNNIKDIDRNNTTTIQMYELFNCMWRSICTISPLKFKKKIGSLSDMFIGNIQNDSQELLCYILDSIHEETKYKVRLTYKYTEQIREYIIKYNNLDNIKNTLTNNKLDTTNINYQIETLINMNRNTHTHYCASIYWEKYVSNSYSIITDLFTGLFYTRTVCKTCNNISEAFDPFVTMSVEIKSEISCSLEECLLHYSKEEILKGNDSYSCSKCKTKVEASKRIYIWYEPEILVIHLKRFDGFGYSVRKINTQVKIPLTDLELKNNFPDFNMKSTKYDLYAVTSHKGNSHGGHYVAYVKNIIDKNWYCFNDEHVYLEENSLQDTFDTSGYLLFYHKQR
jgi:ubiquitin C-terminal hydrolase